MLQMTTSSKMIRAVQVTIAIGAAAAVVACGGNGSKDSTQTNSPPPLPPSGEKMQIVSFGDSLSDGGTYSPASSLVGGAGRYTTNPGHNWPQVVATFYGDNLTPAETGGFMAPKTDDAKGYGYAQG